jgi:hypothetical protein
LGTKIAKRQEDHDDGDGGDDGDETTRRPSNTVAYVWCQRDVGRAVSRHFVVVSRSVNLERDPEIVDE